MPPTSGSRQSATQRHTGRGRGTVGPSVGRCGRVAAEALPRFLLPPLFATADTPADRSIREAFALPPAPVSAQSIAPPQFVFATVSVHRPDPDTTSYHTAGNAEASGLRGHRHRARTDTGSDGGTNLHGVGVFRGGQVGQAMPHLFRRCGPSCAGQPTPSHSNTSGNSSQYSTNGGRSGS